MFVTQIMSHYMKITGCKDFVKRNVSVKRNIQYYLSITFKRMFFQRLKNVIQNVIKHVMLRKKTTFMITLSWR